MKFASGYILGGATVVGLGVAFFGGVVATIAIQQEVDTKIEDAKKDATSTVINRLFARNN